MSHSRINININNIGNYYIDFNYNDNSTFDDLLEYVSYYLSNICPCYKFLINYSYDKKKEINGNEKLNEYLNYYTTKFLLYLPNEVCKCNQYVKNLYNKSKITIINELIKIDEEKNSYKNKLDSLKNDYIINNYLTLKGEVQNLEKGNIEKEIEIVNLKEKINEFYTKKQNYKYKENKLIENISELNEQLEKLNKEEQNFKDKRNQLEDEIEKLNKQIKIKKKNIKDFKDKEIQLNEEICNLKKGIKKLNEQETFSKTKEVQLNETKEKLYNEKSLFQLTHNQLKIDTETGNIIGNEKPENNNKSFTKFYDVIIDIKSIKDINKGWPIKMNQKGEENYNKYKNEKIIKIGVIGNSNKGKSFLLSKISKFKLPSGYSIKTEGLSIKYPELKEYINRKIVLLDSAGLETPVLNEESSNTKNDVNKNDNQKDNLTENNNKEKDYFREKSREKLITELFLQNYIINNSDILIIVIGILTYSEQKLLNKIKTEIIKTKKKSKNNIDKPLILIIHNLMTYTLVEQVEEYIREILLKCSTFTLVAGHKTSTSKENIKGKYFYEESNELKIFHLIYANEGSEAGNYYNGFTLNYIEQSYQNITNLTSFDVMKTIKERFYLISPDIIEKTEDKSKIEFEEENNKLIKLKSPSDVTLKKCFIDELGFSNLKANGFEPTYNYYIKDNQYLMLKIESPGNSEINAIYQEEQGYKFIKINGKKKRDKEPKDLDGNNANNTREFGDFFLNIPLKLDPEILIQNTKPNIDEKKGVIFIQFNLGKRSEAGSLTLNESDEI